jgi:hypothetical protein
MSKKNESDRDLTDLKPDEKKAFYNRLRAYLAYEDEIKESRDAQKEQIQACAQEIPGVDKKTVRKFFTYFKKRVTPRNLKTDAEVLEDLEGLNETVEEDYNV